MLTISRFVVAGVTGVSFFSSIGCDDKSAPTPPAHAATDADHAHGPDGEHAPANATHAAGHGGAVIALGTGTAGPFGLMATRDQGAIDAGKDAPIDVTVVPAAGSTAKAVAVRFWIGTQDAKGSVKAKAAVENPAEPNHWHTHTEIPSPLPAEAKLWVEIEAEGGTRSVAGFDLKR